MNLRVVMSSVFLLKKGKIFPVCSNSTFWFGYWYPLCCTYFWMYHIEDSLPHRVPFPQQMLCRLQSCSQSSVRCPGTAKGKPGRQTRGRQTSPWHTEFPVPELLKDNWTSLTDTKSLDGCSSSAPTSAAESHWNLSSQFQLEHWHRDQLQRFVCTRQMVSASREVPWSGEMLKLCKITKMSLGDLRIGSVDFLE